IFTLSRFAVQPELTKKDFELELTEILKNIALDPDLALNGSISREMPDLVRTGLSSLRSVRSPCSKFFFVTFC
ncbi:MAG TPA: hypothetical protein VN952_00800, partial [Chthoniobacterales bacterium]|nr:hypothetical protein [Chthoniobacterales bacterium]